MSAIQLAIYIKRLGQNCNFISHSFTNYSHSFRVLLKTHGIQHQSLKQDNSWIDFITPLPLSFSLVLSFIDLSIFLLPKLRITARNKKDIKFIIGEHPAVIHFVLRVGWTNFIDFFSPQLAHSLIGPFSSAAIYW